MHKLDVVHGDIRIVRPFLHPHFDRAFTFIQANILVDSNRRARVAGLGAAYISSLMPEVDIDKFFEAHGAAPELVNPQHFGLRNARATKESDMYAFGALAYEVSPTVTVSHGEAIRNVYSLRCSLGMVRFSKRVTLLGLIQTFVVDNRHALYTLNFLSVCGM